MRGGMSASASVADGQGLDKSLNKQAKTDGESPVNSSMETSCAADLPQSLNDNPCDSTASASVNIRLQEENVCLYTQVTKLRKILKESNISYSEAMVSKVLSHAPE